MSRVLHLHLKAQYFDEIASGVKTEEFRSFTPYWRKRLTGSQFSSIIIYRGFPKKNDWSKILLRPFRGFRLGMIQHPQFGDEPVFVFAIRVNP